MATRIQLRIRGKVQGVGFRWFVREQARRCDLAGWVRNHPDGSVELHASGDDDCLQRLRMAIAVGPAGAHVLSVEEISTGGSDDSAEELPHPFRIER